MTITEFLLARIAEDEADPWRGAVLIGADRIVGEAEADALLAEEGEWLTRVRRECEAKRRIVEFCDVVPGYVDPGEAILARDTLLALASVYADHPDYREEWRDAE